MISWMSLAAIHRFSYLSPVGLRACSVYDDFGWMDNWGDPQFGYPALIARLLGTLLVHSSSVLVRSPWVL